MAKHTYRSRLLHSQRRDVIKKEASPSFIHRQDDDDNLRRSSVELFPGNAMNAPVPCVDNTFRVEWSTETRYCPGDGCLDRELFDVYDESTHRLMVMNLYLIYDYTLPCWVLCITGTRLPKLPFSTSIHHHLMYYVVGIIGIDVI